MSWYHHQIAVYIVLNNVAWTLAIVGNSRHAMGKRLQQNIAEGIKARGKNKQVQTSIEQGKHFAPPSQETVRPADSLNSSSAGPLPAMTSFRLGSDFLAATISGRSNIPFSAQSAGNEQNRRLVVCIIEQITLFIGLISLYPGCVMGSEKYAPGPAAFRNRSASPDAPG